MNEAPVIVRALTHGYVDGGVRRELLSGLEFECDPATLVMLVGPSGCGKSTLLSILGGLLTPDAGEVRICGLDTVQASEAELERMRRTDVAFVFQQSHLFAALTAVEQVSLPLRFDGVPAREARLRARACLDLVQLSHCAERRPAQLSGGERQRVALARALARRPRLLLADEPTSALDAANGQWVARLLRDAVREHGTTVICVTHDTRLLPHADAVVALEDGALAPPSEPHRHSVSRCP